MQTNRQANADKRAPTYGPEFRLFTCSCYTLIGIESFVDRGRTWWKSARKTALEVSAHVPFESA